MSIYDGDAGRRGGEVIANAVLPLNKGLLMPEAARGLGREPFGNLVEPLWSQNQTGSNTVGYAKTTEPQLCGFH